MFPEASRRSPRGRRNFSTYQKSIKGRGTEVAGLGVDGTVQYVPRGRRIESLAPSKGKANDGANELEECMAAQGLRTF